MTETTKPITILLSMVIQHRDDDVSYRRSINSVRRQSVSQSCSQSVGQSVSQLVSHTVKQARKQGRKLAIINLSNISSGCKARSEHSCEKRYFFSVNKFEDYTSRNTIFFRILVVITKAITFPSFFFLLVND